MFGIPDFWIWSAYLLCILSTLACIIYGLLNWNRGGTKETTQVQEEITWEKVEQKINE
jgi:hypothetical protein